MTTATALLALSLLQISVQERAVTQEWVGRVTDIKAVNRLTFVSTKNNLPITVRLFGLDAKGLPKVVDADARKLIKATAFGRNCTLQIFFTDKDATPVGLLMCPRSSSDNKVNLGSLLLSKGFARRNAKEAADDALLKKIEARAKSQKLGLWKTAKN